MGMMEIINRILGKGGESPSKDDRDMSDVMRRVNKQIGHAVERLSDR